MNPNFKAKFESVIEAFSKFETRNDDCCYCPFFEEECDGNADKHCLSEDILKLLKRGYQLEENKEIDHAER